MALREQDRESVREHLATGLVDDVSLTLYTQPDFGLYVPGRECPTCRPTRLLVQEVVELSPKLHLEIVNFYQEPERSRADGIDKIPAIVIRSDGGANAKYFGLPSAREFDVFLETLSMSSSPDSSLTLETRTHLDTLDLDVHIQVLVTPN